MTDIQVIGFGNTLRGDDGVAAAAVDALRAGGIAAEAFDGDGTELMALWQGCSAVIVIDAMVSGGEVGSVVRFDAVADPLPQDQLRSSSHHFGLAQAVELARALDELPPRLIVFGVEGQDFEYGAKLSPAVARAVEIVVGDVKAELERITMDLKDI